MSKNKSKKTTRNSSLYLGKESYGIEPLEDAFKKALKPYFAEDNITIYEHESLTKRSAV